MMSQLKVPRPIFMNNNNIQNQAAIMKDFLTRLVMSVAVTLSATSIHAHDFCMENEDGVTMYFNILSSTDKTCEVSRNGDLSYWYYASYLSSVIKIPEKVIYESVEYDVVGIGRNTFINCTSLVSVTIPESVTSIGDDAFSGCGSLASITIPESVTYIGNYAFRGCGSLHSVIIPESVTSINNYTFDGCTRLSSIHIPKSVTSIGNGAFYNCKSFSYVSIPDNVESIGSYAFTGCNMTTVIIGNSVKQIGHNAFLQCYNLTTVTIGSSVKEIGQSAFKWCGRLEEVISKMKEPCELVDVFPSDIYERATLYIPAGTKETYQNVKGWNFKNVLSEGEYSEIQLTDNLQTFCHTQDIEFKENSKVKAYIVYGFKQETGEVLMMPVTGVPAGTGVVLKGRAGMTYRIINSETSFVYSNLLIGSLSETTLTDGYVLKGDCFERVDAPTAIAANSAYLTLPASAQGAKRLSLKFLDETTDIEQVETGKTMSDGNWYSLQGTRMNGTPTAPGIYIRNGRKVMKK